MWFHAVTDTKMYGWCNKNIRCYFLFNKLRRSVVAAGEKQATADYRISKRYKHNILLMICCLPAERVSRHNVITHITRFYHFETKYLYEYVLFLVHG